MPVSLYTSEFMSMQKGQAAAKRTDSRTPAAQTAAEASAPDWFKISKRRRGCLREAVAISWCVKVANIPLT